MRVACCVLLVLGMAMFLACGGAATSSVNYGSSGDVSTEIDACAKGQMIMKRLLKYPDDAEFQWGARAAKQPNGLWGVVGKVKAANGFGNKLTHTYVVMLELTDAEKKTWKLRGAQLGDEVLYTSSEPIAALEETAEDKAKRAEMESRRAAELEQRRLAEQQKQEAEERAAAEKIAAAKAADQLARRRTWRTNDGRFTVEADFVSFVAGVVKLRRVDNGKEITIDADTLSAGDLAWIESRKR